MTTTEIAKTTIAFTISRIIVGFTAATAPTPPILPSLTFPRRFAKAKSPFMSRGSSAHFLQPVRICTGREALLSFLNFSQKAVSPSSLRSSIVVLINLPVVHGRVSTRDSIGVISLHLPLWAEISGRVYAGSLSRSFRTSCLLTGVESSPSWIA